MTDETRDTWLDGTQAEAAALMRPLSGDVLRIVQEGFDKKDLAGDSMKPVTLSDLIRDGKTKWTYCTSCCRERNVDPASDGGT